ETYLQARFVPTMKLLVSGPKWQEIRVITEIVPVSVENADAVRVAVSDRLHSFLHPLTGGDWGRGWSFGRKPHHSDLYAVLEKVPGVNYVRALDIQPGDAVIDKEVREQGDLSKGESSNGDSTPLEREPLLIRGGLRPMFGSASRQEEGVISPSKVPPSPSLFVDIQTLIYSGQHIVTLKLPGDTD
ncbi:MAG: hypothetical protein ACYT04_62495, partial [Nostoc sp.]